MHAKANDFVASIGLMVALARSGDLECYSDHNGIHIRVKGEEVASLSMKDRPHAESQKKRTTVAILLGA